MNGYTVNIEKEALANNHFRRVLYTTKNSQLVLMNLKPSEEIGAEVHNDLDQFIRVENGTGKSVLNGKEHSLEDGSAVVIPSGTEHNIINTGTEDMKLYTIYSPPHHRDGVIHETKVNAEADDEHFDGTTTE